MRNPDSGNKAIPRRDRSKTGPTPKRQDQRALRFRLFSATDAAYANLGIAVRSVRQVNRQAVIDAIDALDINDLAARRELIWLADTRRSRDELLRHCDVFATRYPDDTRWDSWRRHRRTELAGVN